MTAATLVKARDLGLVIACVYPYPGVRARPGVNFTGTGTMLRVQVQQVSRLPALFEQYWATLCY